MSIDTLKKIKDLSEAIFIELYNQHILSSGSGCSYDTNSYALRLYDRMLKMSTSGLRLLKAEDYTAVPLVVRNLIELIVDLANIRLYGGEYRRHLELSNLTQEINFYFSSYDDYNNLFAPQKESDKKIEFLSPLRAKQNNLIQTMKNHRIPNLNYVPSLIKDDGTIDERSLKSKFTQTFKFGLLLDERFISTSSYKPKIDRHRRYKVCYYLMSKFIHNSIEFIPNYEPRSNLTAYIDVMASVLKNGVIYISDIMSSRIDDRKFKQLKNYKKQIKEVPFKLELGFIN